MVWAAALACTTDRRFLNGDLDLCRRRSFFLWTDPCLPTYAARDRHEGGWCAAPEFAVSYALGAIFLVLLFLYSAIAGLEREVGGGIGGGGVVVDGVEPFRGEYWIEQRERTPRISLSA